MMRLSAKSKRMLAVALYTSLGCAVSLYVASRFALDTTAALSGFRLFFVHLQVFVEAMWARFQGTYVEFVGFKEEWYSAAAIMPSTSYVLAVLSAYFFMDVVVPLLALTENLRFLPAAIVFDFVMVPYTLVIVARSLIYILLHVDDYVWVYAYATFVLTVWAWTDSRPFRAASIAFGLVAAAPYTLGKVGLTLLLAFVYPILGTRASGLFLNVVGWVLGSRVTTWVRKWPPVGSWAGVALALWDGWRADSYGRKILMWMLTLIRGAAWSTASWIVCGISSMASILYSEGSDVFFLSPKLLASFVLWLAIWIVVRHFSTHSVVRCGSFLMATSLVNATGHLWILIKIASAVIFIDTTLAPLWKWTCSVSTSGDASEAPYISSSTWSHVATLCLWAGAAVRFYYDGWLVVLTWVLWASLVSDAVYRFSNFAHPLVRPAALCVATRLAVALDDPCPLIMLGAAIHLTPLWTWLRVVTCGASSELKASTTLRFNGVPSSQSSDSCAPGSGSTDVGGGVDETPHEQDGATPSARAAGFTRAAALLALSVYGFTKTFHGQLGTLFDKVTTASVALTGATATTSASSTSFMGSLNVSKVLSVASALLVVRAVRAGWRDMDAGMTRDRANYLREVDAAFFKLAPGLLEPLKSQRVINAVIHDLSEPNWHEGARRVFRRDRVGYEFGKVVPTPAPALASRGALKPANSPQRLPKKPRT